MSYLLTKVVAAFVLPPLVLLLPGFLGLLLLRSHRRAAIGLLIVSLAGFLVLSMPFVADPLARAMEGRPTGTVAAGDAQAIVILAGGNYVDAPEYGGDTVNAWTLERVRWGARVHRATGLPIAVTGGAPASRTPEAIQMQATLNQDFGMEAKWVEKKSLTTLDNARNLRVQLAAEKIDRIILVTHALHMRRAHLVFERAGFQVVDSATGYTTERPLTILSYLPSVRSYDISAACMQELIGLGWYHLRLAAGALQKGSQ
jgi:uncharacterized SAM-binding protein YcdF (DUF218 family)